MLAWTKGICSGGAKSASKASIYYILFLCFSTIGGVCFRSADNLKGFEQKGFIQF